MLNGKTLITMDGRNVVFSVVQDRSKIQTFPPTVFKMSTQQQTAEKSVQTHDSTGSLLVSNNPVTHFHAENAAAEVANTLVSMATGRQRPPNVKQLSVINVSTPTTLPILALADYTTAHGVPTAMALASQAKISPVKHEEIIDAADDDNNSMSTDEYNPTRTELNASTRTRTKSTRMKSGKSNSSSSKSSAQQAAADAIQYGPLLVKPRKSVAPTLANGRRSKDAPLPPDEDHKRRQRRDRNKEAAAKCRRKRNDLREQLEKAEKILLDEQKTLERNVQTLSEQKNQLEVLLHRHPCTKKGGRLPIATTTNNNVHLSKSIPVGSLLDSNNNSNSKRVTINFANAQDLFAMAPLTRGTGNLITTDGSSSSGMPMITIHIIPEVAQALLGSTTVDKAKLAELLQQASVGNSSESLMNNNNNNTNSSS